MIDLFFSCFSLFLRFLFFCRALDCDILDQDLAEILAVAGLFLVALPSFFLENDHFIAPYRVVKHFGGYLGSLDERFADTDFSVLVNEQDLVEFNLRTYLSFKSMNEDLVILLHFELLSCDFNNYVHDIAFYSENWECKVIKKFNTSRFQAKKIGKPYLGNFATKGAGYTLNQHNILISGVKNVPRWHPFRIMVLWWTVTAFAFAGSHSAASTAATLTGVVTNSVTGAGIVGARIEVNGLVTWSVTAGVYNLTVDPPGTYAISCSKAGYDTFISAPVVFQQGATVIVNIQLQESANPPVNATAVLDTSLQTVHVNWAPPAGTYELLYDDGMQDNFTIWATQGNMNGVRFTPPAYPAAVTGGSVHLGHASNYPPGGNPLVPFQVAVFDAAGSGGMPGNLIGGPFDIIPTHLGWVEFSFPSTVPVASGNFYLVMVQGGSPPDAAGLAVDETVPQLRSVQRFVSGAGPWIPAGGNFMMRAVLQGAGGPVDLGDNGDALLGYHVWRLRQGEEQNPAIWVDLGTTIDPNLNDPGWFSFPCGPYIWGIQARFTGNRLSPVCLSNILGKCWTAGVTVQADLSCIAGNKAGTGVYLKNLVYNDTSYAAETDTTGLLLFPAVWKGTYELTLTKFGYQQQVLTVPVSHDTSLTAFLLQEKSPPRELEVNEKTLVAHWQIPEYKEELFAEDWSSAGFAANGWTTEGGNNWTISTVIGNPAPSAMFNWSPQVSGYSQSLVSTILSGEHAPVLMLRYDISLDNFGTTTLNQMAVEIWNGVAWNVLQTYDNSAGTFPWVAGEVEISAYSATPFRIRFHATGGDSFDINGWFIDNIRIEGSETPAGQTNCVLGYNVYLDNVLSGFTTDTKYSIPGNQVQYGQSYNVCVNAVYGSGWSDDVCVPFTSGFLWPPLNLAAAVIENAVELTWLMPEMPDSLGQMVTPPGLLGYRIYRNSALADSVEDPGTLSWFDLGLEPGNYQYEVTAWYDLTEYGFPAQFDESMAAGPVSVLINFGRPLPFLETWDQASFSFNEWQFEPAPGNWIINTAEGNPAPTAEFNWEPFITDYKYSLETPALDGSGIHCGTIRLDFDLALQIINPTGQERLSVELYYDDLWHTVAEYTNDSTLAWGPCSIDISEVAGQGFIVGFKANGVNSTDIYYWRIDNIHVYAVCFGPTDLQADAQGYDVALTWRPPDCTGSNMYLNEGFETGSFPPESWTQVITDPASTWSQMNALSPVGIHSGNYSAGVLWDYVHQDEWLIAENVIVNGNLEFWSYAFQGSVHNDHYYVKISSDEGSTWDILFDLSTLPPYPGPGGYNQWNEPYTVDLSAYMDQVVHLAWQGVDGDGGGLWYSWAIDDCYIGGKKLQVKGRNGPPDNLLGYDIFRRDAGSPDFVKVNTNLVSDTFYTDPGLAAGQYEYFISPFFTECTLAEHSDTVLIDVITALYGSGDRTWRIYPVPATNLVTVESDEPLTSIEIVNVQGVVVRRVNPSGLKNPVDISTLPSGPYLVRMISSSHARNRLIVIN
jgi:hypothetical protein